MSAIGDFLATNQPESSMLAAQLDSIVSLAKSGKLEDARQACESGLVTEPHNAELLHLRGLLCTLSGQPGDAIAFIRRAIAVDPVAKYWSNLGNALVATHQPDEAERAYRSATALDPAFADAWFNLGNLLFHRARPVEAVDALNQAVRLDPEDARAWRLLGDAHEQLRHYADVRRAYEEGFRVTRGDPEFAALLAYCLERENRLEASREMAGHALSAQPQHVLANLVMAILDRRASRFSEARSRLQTMSEAGIPPSMQVLREHELGVLEDRAGSHESAYAHIVRAKALQSNLPAFVKTDCQRFLSRLDVLINCDYAWLMECRHGYDDGLHDPVLIVGFPRSGTTLLNQFLNGHPGLHVMEEVPLLSALERELAGKPIDTTTGLPALTNVEVLELRQRYFDLARSFQPDWDGKRRLVDKLPLNLSRIPLAVRLFPDARIILSLRHPYDACLSGFMQLFSPNDAMCCFASLESAATLYERLFTLWEKMSPSLPASFLPVRYEDLVTEPEIQLRRILQFLELPWMDGLQDHTRTVGQRGFINTPSYQQVARPLHRESLQRWRAYAPHFKPLEPRLLRFVKAWGYEADSSH